MSSPVHDFLHSLEVKDIGKIIIDEAQAVVDAEAEKYPFAFPVKQLADSFFHSLAARLEHLASKQQAKEAAPVDAAAAPASEPSA